MIHGVHLHVTVGHSGPIALRYVSVSGPSPPVARVWLRALSLITLCSFSKRSIVAALMCIGASQTSSVASMNRCTRIWGIEVRTRGARPLPQSGQTDAIARPAPFAPLYRRAPDVPRAPALLSPDNRNRLPATHCDRRYRRVLSVVTGGSPELVQNTALGPPVFLLPIPAANRLGQLLAAPHRRFPTGTPLLM